ncbi:MAG TPA: substrate-binding domain-containing protein [Pseudonocardia sp.]
MQRATGFDCRGLAANDRHRGPAVNDLIAPGALQRLFARGVAVPDDMSVAGCNDTFGADHGPPHGPRSLPGPRRAIARPGQVRPEVGSGGLRPTGT